jgi:serine/threonine-protein phosphatase 2A activator
MNQGKIEMDIEAWTGSASFRGLNSFICDILDNPLRNQWDSTIDLSDLLESIEQCVIEFKVSDDTSFRFGNKDFKPFIEGDVYDLIDAWKPIQDHSVDKELKSHLKSSFGNLSRIDYGTGHELEFLIFLFIYSKLTSQTESPNRLFYSTYPRYYRLQKKIINKFRLEPAGSRGVWGIDDYFFLPFLFGSSQLINTTNPEFAPNQVILKQNLNNAKAEGSLENYLYLWALMNNYEEKGSNFSSHSPLLWDLSGLTSWSKISNGLLKMYKKEVLSNKTIIQHLKFGSLFPCE